MVTYTLADLQAHKTKKSLWLLVHGHVYDVTKFADQHPGSDDILVEASGKDATQDFVSVGHSPTATDMMKDFYIGDLEGATPSESNSKSNDQLSSQMSSIIPFIPFLLIISTAFLLKHLFG